VCHKREASHPAGADSGEESDVVELKILFPEHGNVFGDYTCVSSMSALRQAPLTAEVIALGRGLTLVLPYLLFSLNKALDAVLPSSALGYWRNTVKTRAIERKSMII